MSLTLSKSSLYDVLLIYTEHFYLSSQMSILADVNGLGILSAMANAKGYKTKIYRGEANKTAEVLETEINNHQVKVVGFYCHFYNQAETMALTSFIKQKYPDVKTLIGGPQTITADKEFFAKSLADAAVLGEGEDTFLELLDFYFYRKEETEKNLREIKGISFIDSANNLIITPPRPPVEKLDELPYPEANDYLDESTKSSHVQLLTGRGCPYSCAFCHESLLKGKVRLRSVPHIVGELEQKLETYNKKHSFIRIYDDTFTLNLTRLESICREFIRLRKNYDFIWFAEGHVEKIAKQPEMIEMMIEAGLTHLQIGVESGVQAVLEKYNKRISLEQIEKVVSLCSEKNLQQMTFNILFGGALETEETISQSAEFALKLLHIGKGMVEVWPVHYMPFPATPMTNNPEKYGLNIIDAQALTSMQDYPVVQTQRLSRARIFELSKQFKQKIDRTMLAQTQEIPFERALGFFRNELLYNASSLWYAFISREVHKHMYYTRIVHGAQSARNIPPGQIMSYRPMRTVLLHNYDGEGFGIHNYRLSSLESEILLYSAGKMALSEIAHMLHPTFGGEKSFEEFSGQIIEIIKTFDRRAWVNLSKF